MNYFISLLILLTVVFQSDLMSQKRKRNTFKADQVFKAGEFHQAAEKYKKIYTKSKNSEQKAELAFKIGQCYRNINAPKDADSWYKKALRGNKDQPEAYLYYADALKMQGEFEDAKEAYTEYMKLMPEDPRGKNGLNMCDSIEKWMKEESKYILKPMTSFNSKESDFSVTILGFDEVLFTSSREGSTGEEFSNAAGMGFTDIYYSQMDNKKSWSTPVPVKGKVNTEFDEGTPVVTNDGKTLYYTSCSKAKKTAMGCRIYTSSRSGDSWSEPGEVEIVKDSSITVAHPAPSKDESTMYFVADSTLHGGLGGKDIWVVTRNKTGGGWSKPKNLGPDINTAGDEMYPYFWNDSTLYFSSNGHPSMGGLDIFKAVKTGEDTWHVENLKPPFNSMSDDFGIVFENEKQTKGYFTSTRKADGGKKDNIWSFEIPPLEFALEGKVENSQTNKPIDGVLVQMMGSNGTMKKFTTKEDGTFKFDLEEETDYILTTKKTKYLIGKGEETTRGHNESKVFNMLVVMDPISDSIAIELPNIEYAFNDTSLRVESQVSLDKLVEVLEDNPTIIIELRAHTDFRGKDEYNDKLSQGRANSVVKYLIDNGVNPVRLSAKGYGEQQPKLITEKIATNYSFLKPGDVLSEEFITKLQSEEEQEICHQLNRRTEFQVLRTDYKGN